MGHRLITTPDRLFERSWRPGYPYARRLSRSRRWGMAGIFFVLATIIGGYWYITDSERAPAMAESYLTTVLGGPVKVGRANLSLFEGLRLDDVEVRVDDNNDPDAVIFSAKTFHIQYNLRSMLSRRLEATTIRAIDPHVRLSENRDTGKWNYQRMVRAPRPMEPRSQRPIVLPEIILRNAQIDYSEIRGGQFIELGSMAIEGRLSPDNEPGRYAFDLQSRGQTEGIGPVVSGSVVMGTGQVSARMKNFEFGRDIRTMLPAQVRDWWGQHELAGRVDIPELTYTPGRDGKAGSFKVETQLDNVMLAVYPQEWRGSAENRAIESISWTLATVRRLGAGGLRAPQPRGDDDAPLLDRLAAQFDAGPIRLQKVSGTFVFTEDGIDITNVAGRVETNGFKVSGRIDGYTPDATATLRVSSLDTENLFIPHAPRYVKSLPMPVRELYDHLRPEGTCSLWMQITRATPGARPQVTGEVNVIDGQFVFDKFAYPLRHATGKILIGHDDQTGDDRLEIVDLRGRGVPGGPNSDSFVTLNGIVSPLGPDSAVTIRIAAQNISSEPALREAFPGPVRKTLAAFDAPGKGEFPQFHGDFVCDVLRPRGYNQHWTINVDIDVRDSRGALVGFPYPLSGVSGRIEVREGHVDLRNISMNRGDSSLRIDGKVSWAPDDTPRAWDDPRNRNRPLVPELTVTARGVPIDKDLLAALPPERRAWLERIGVGGKLDIDGKIIAPAEEPSAPVPPPGVTAAARPDTFSYDLELALHDGTMWPDGGTFALSGLEAKMHLTPTSLELREIAGRRGDAKLTGFGLIAWPKNQPHVNLRASVTELVLDSSVYNILPAQARGSWDQVHPEGVVDADITYSGAVPTTAPSSSPPPTTAPATMAAVSMQGLEVTVRPRKLSVTPQAVPYRLDDLTGEVKITSGEVTLTDLAARHGDAKIRLSGVGQVGGRGSWALKLGGADVLVDDDLMRALPETLSGLLQSLKMWGKIDFEFSRLDYRDPEPATPSEAEAIAAEASAAASDSATRPGGATSRPLPHADVDFAARITARGAGLDVGVPLSGVNGTIDLAGTVRHGAAQELAGRFDITSLTLAGREMKNLRADIAKPRDQAMLQISKVQGEIAGGEMVGQADLAFPENAPARYAVTLALRNADVQQLSGDLDDDDKKREIKGQLNASLDVAGAWSDPKSRRGRGDVKVAGKSMYRIPVVLGLLQITNLSLPINQPFNEASTRYTLDGDRVTFENIELRSKDMLMQGHGKLDFGTKKVRMTFVTDNPGWPKLPFVGDLLEGAKNELLQIHVKGTLQEPKVSASSMSTFTTTVDEVFKGDGKE